MGRILGESGSQETPACRARTGSGAARGNGGYADDEVRVAAGGPTAGATPFVPPAGGQGAPGRPETQSGNRAREARPGGAVLPAAPWEACRWVAWVAWARAACAMIVG
ncbi:hypothetical protein OG866_36995 [Streptomyces sp. NBC_00663]|uniref:hypothetical protein n=1 Tax=Streptomyces sp. NBC_00663 TaxID=2975801 RepID=UPI002E339277|nr:hypothetical protein [Streptomyces sp. NBC_00663]